MKILFDLLILLLLSGCASTQRSNLDPIIKEDLGWDSLTFEEKMKAYSLLSPKSASGLGSITMDETSSSSDTSVGFSDALQPINSAIDNMTQPIY